MTEPIAVLPPRNWPAFLMFTATLLLALTAVPLYGYFYGYDWSAWIAFAALLTITELSITCGYHRLFAHAAYQARPVLKSMFLLFGAMALQNSALNWCAGHRVHHRFLDDPERDPYCARRGLWFSHIGWMLRNYPSGDPDLHFVRELQRDPLVAFQHRYYLVLAVGMNVLVPLVLGLVFGHIGGMFLLAGVSRLVLSHHLTFCINSFAHALGSQPYSKSNTARDNGILSVLTFGEGYHNFHHQFAHDYRNGVRWWQWDPSKWLIKVLHWMGLVHNMKRTSWFTIRRAMLDSQFQDTQRVLACQPTSRRLEEVGRRVAEEYGVFKGSIAAWTALQELSLITAKQSLLEQWDQSSLVLRFKALEQALVLQQRRMRCISAQLTCASSVIQ